MFRKIVKKDVLRSLSRHKDISTEFFDKIKGMEKVILENIGTDLAKKAVSMSREVNGDLHEHKAFLRLSVSPYGILYAKIDKMKHRNEIVLLEFFKARFPTFIILFESKRGVFAYEPSSSFLVTDLSLKEALRECEEKMDINPVLMDLIGNNYNYQELWESFAQSQIIKEKRTSKQVLNLSKKWINTVPKDKSNLKPLDDFF
jgi:hypothetical protein